MSRATPEATRTFCHSRIAEGALRTQWGRSGLVTSRFAFGGYRASVRSTQHKDALVQAIASGCNVVDTSTNYTDGQSLDLVGAVVGVSVAVRPSIVIVSKVGYIQGSRLRELKKQNSLTSSAKSELVVLDEDCWHCIHPEFIEQEITRTLQKLQTDCIDVLLLHNPEYYLKTSQDRPEYERRIEAAFECLEKEVSKGRIAWYGVSSNTFVVGENDPEFTSLEHCWEAAKKAGGTDHHFLVAQMPFNLFEVGAWFIPRASGLTTLQFAKRNGIVVLGNRPFNSFAKGQFRHLVEVKDSKLYKPNHLESCKRDAQSLESQIPGEAILPQSLQKKLRILNWLDSISQKISDYGSWRDFIQTQFNPAWDAIVKEASSHSQAQLWLEQHDKYIRAYIDAITLHKLHIDAKACKDLKSILTETAVALSSSATLSQMLLRVYAGTTGMNVILVGMRHVNYVSDVMSAAEPLDFSSVEACYKRFL